MRKKTNLLKGILFMLLWTFSLSVLAQNITLRGVVYDASKRPLGGASVAIEGTSTTTVTDEEGRFTMSNVPPNAVLEISYIGMLSQKISVNSRTTINVTMQDDDALVEEVIVVGYGTQKKQSVVGSIVQTSGEDLQRAGNVSDLRQALTGQLPGLTTLTSGGEPGGPGSEGSMTDIFIRGRNTWNGGGPLILVDGVERAMENVDVNEVETISVLKDASATAVFGVKGANGVILITTKRGRLGKPEMTFNHNSTALSVSRLPEKLDSYDTRRLQNEMIEREVALNSGSWADYTPYDILNRYMAPQSAEYAEIYPNVDWADAMFKDFSMSSRTAFSMRGGTEVVDYFGSVAYLREADMFKEYDNGKGYSPNFDFNRFNYRSNLGFNLTNTTKLKVDLAGYFSTKGTNSEFFQTNNSANNPMVWAAAYSMAPDLYHPQYSDGLWGAAGDIVNPVAVLYNTGIFQYKTTAMNSNFALEQDLNFVTEGLSAVATFFYDTRFFTTRRLSDAENARPNDGNLASKQIHPERYLGPWQDPSEYTTLFPQRPIDGSEYDWVLRRWGWGAESVNNSALTRRMAYQGQLNYGRQFGDHNIGGTALFRREEWARGSEFMNYREDWVFRATYDYDGRYLFEANGAYNGSEKFGPEYRFKFFPSVGLGYNVSNETFWKVDFMNRLKLKYTIGWVGDDQGGPRHGYTNQYAFGGGAHLQSSSGHDPGAWGFPVQSPYTWYRQDRLGNPDLRWETAKKQNVGAEMGFFQDMISLNVDYFTEHRYDIIVGNMRNIPSYFGTAAPPANVGEVKARGYEIEARLNHRFNDNFSVWAMAAMTHTKNEVILRDDPELLPSYLKDQGYSIGQQRSIIIGDFYNNWDEVYASTPTEVNDGQKLPGYYHLVDFNGDGVISAQYDTAPIGYPNVPLNTYNLTLGGEYKNFSLMVQFFGVNNVSLNQPQNNYGLISSNTSLRNVLFAHALDHWSQDNPNATSFLPRWKSQGQNVGNYFMHDGSYVRLKTAEVAYRFDRDLMSRFGLGGLRLYVNGNNLLFWSKLPDDRESYSHGGNQTYEGAYPTPRRINFGLELTF